MIGGTADSMSINAVNPIGGPNVAWNGSWIFDASGATPTSAASFGNTGLQAAVSDPFGFDVYVNKSAPFNPGPLTGDIGALDFGLFDRDFLNARTSGSMLSSLSSSAGAVLAVATDLGLSTARRFNPFQIGLSKNGGAFLFENVVQTSKTNTNIYLGNINNGGPDTSPQRRYAFFMSCWIYDTDMPYVYSVIQNYQTALGRNV